MKFLKISVLSILGFLLIMGYLHNPIDNELKLFKNILFQNKINLSMIK